MLKSIKKLLASSWHREIYNNIIYISYIFFAFAFTGITVVSPSYLNVLEIVIKYYVCFFLLLRFNPLVSKHIKYTREIAEFDRRIAFSAGVFLIFTTTLTTITFDYLNKVKHTIIY